MTEIHRAMPSTLTRPMTLPFNQTNNYNRNQPGLSRAGSIPTNSTSTITSDSLPFLASLPMPQQQQQGTSNVDRSLQTTFRKLLVGLQNRNTEYCKRLQQFTEHAIGQLNASNADYNPHNSNDILNFTGIPYQAPSEPDLPASPSNSSPGTPSNAFNISNNQSLPNPLSPMSAPASPAFPSQFVTQLNTPYVTDLTVNFGKFKSQQTSTGYTIVERTISGIHRANLNKGGSSQKTHLAFKRTVSFANHPKLNGTSHSTSSTTAPLTSVGLFFKNRADEEPPLGFQSIDRNAAGEDCCLHPSSNTSARQPYLCTHRGEGAPITHIGLISRAFKETLPTTGGWHEVKQTFIGSRADLSVNPTMDSALYLCFRVDIKPIIAKWADVTSQLSHQEESIHYSRIFAILAAVLYSYDQKLILFTFEVFRKLDRHSIPPVLLNLFVTQLCDATPLFLVYFQSISFSFTLQFLLHVFRQCCNVLSIGTTVKIVDTCLRLRHEDKQSRVSEGLIEAVLAGMRDRLRPCECHRSLYGDSHDADGRGVDSGASTPAPLSPSSTNQSSPPLYGVLASNGLQTCYRCAERDAMDRAPTPTDFARLIVQRRIDEVRRQHSLNENVRIYRTHSDLSSPFRTDLAQSIDQLLIIDDETLPMRSHLPISRRSQPRFNFNSISGLPGDQIREETEESMTSAENNQNHVSHQQHSRHNPELDQIAQTHSMTVTIETAVQTLTPPRKSSDLATTNGGLLVPAAGFSHDSDDDEDSHISTSTFESQSEFHFPEFHGESDSDMDQPATIDEGDEDEFRTSAEQSKGSTPVRSGATTPADINLGRPIATRLDQSGTQPGPLSLSEETNFSHRHIGQSETTVLSTSPSLSHVYIGVNPLSPIDPRRTLDDGNLTDDDDRALPVVDQLHAPRKHERLLLALACSWSKAACEPAPFGRKDSETFRRKQHALEMLFQLLESSYIYFRTYLAASLALRRFIMPCLMTASVTDNTLMFRSIMQVLGCLYSRLRSECCNEVGTFVDKILLPLLGNKLCSPAQKMNVLDVMGLSIFQNPKSVILLYYNYDNSCYNWPIFERTMSTLSSLVQAPASSDEAEVALQRQALKLLVQLLFAQGQWLGVPHLHRHSDIRAIPLLDETGESRGRLDVPRNNARRASWSSRQSDHKQNAAVVERAVALASTDSLKAALTHLKQHNPQAGRPSEIAWFLYTTPSLDKVEVGDFLSSTTDKFMHHEDYKRVRLAYVELLDFTGQSLDMALRSFLCDAGFRLPGESQKIDRLLDAFCMAYVRDNPHTFKNFDAALTLTFALVMLNTDAHDPRLKNNDKRKQMTLEQFVRNLRGTNDGEDFPRPMLEHLYAAIHADEIRWTESKEERKLTESEIRLLMRKQFEVIVRKALAYSKNHVCDLITWRTTDDTSIVRALFERCWKHAVVALTFRSEANMADVEVLHSCLDGLAYGATISIVLGLPVERKAFTAQLAKIIFIEKERSRTDSAKKAMIDRLKEEEHLKQDWYRPLNLQIERQPQDACNTIFQQTSQVKQLIGHERAQAQLRRIEGEFGGEIALVEPHRSLVKQGRLTKLNSAGNKRAMYQFMLFTDLILYASEGMNQRYKLHRVVHLSLCRLEDLRSSQFPHAFRIISPQKSFLVMAADANDKKRWIDAMLTSLQTVMEKRRRYVEAAHPGNKTATDPMNVRKASEPASLSMGPSASSPTSSGSPTRRQDFLRNSSSMDFSVGGVGNHLAKGSEHQLRRYSTFIGNSEFDLNTEHGNGSASQRTSSSHCKLCIRPFNLFRRRNKCRWCDDIVCVECSSQKVKSPGAPNRLICVCDACYGALTGMVGQDTQLLTIREDAKGSQSQTSSPHLNSSAVAAQQLPIPKRSKMDRRRTT